MVLSLDIEPMYGASVLLEEIKSFPTDPFSMLPSCLGYRLDRETVPNSLA